MIGLQLVKESGVMVGEGGGPKVWKKIEVEGGGD